MCCAGGGSQAVEQDADVLSLGIFNFLYFMSFQSSVGEGPWRSAPRAGPGQGTCRCLAGNREQEIRCTLGQNLLFKFQSS